MDQDVGDEGPARRHQLATRGVRPTATERHGRMITRISCGMRSAAAAIPSMSLTLTTRPATARRRPIPGTHTGKDPNGVRVAGRVRRRLIRRRRRGRWRSFFGSVPRRSWGWISRDGRERARRERQGSFFPGSRAVQQASQRFERPVQDGQDDAHKRPSFVRVYFNGWCVFLTIVLSRPDASAGLELRENPAARGARLTVLPFHGAGSNADRPLFVTLFFSFHVTLLPHSA
jgi:hypothetical protein